MRRWRQNLRFLAAVQLLPALESGEETLVGGQAVLEGVMMRGISTWAVAVRKPVPEDLHDVDPPTWSGDERDAVDVGTDVAVRDALAAAFR